MLKQQAVDSVIECVTQLESTIANLRRIRDGLVNTDEYRAVSVETMVERHDALKHRLQALYGGNAPQYFASSDGGGTLYPPVGYCFSELYIRTIDSYREQVDLAQGEMACLEAELKTRPYVPSSPHPMIRLKLPTNEGPAHTAFSKELSSQTERHALMRKIAGLQATSRLYQEHLDFWRSSVKPATPEFLAELMDLYKEKEHLRAQLVLNHGVHVSQW